MEAVTRPVHRQKSRSGWLVLALTAIVATSAFGVKVLRHGDPLPPQFVQADATTLQDGRVQSVLVHEGQIVRKGQLLAALDCGEYEEPVESARSALVAEVSATAGNTGPVALPILGPLKGGFEQKPVLEAAPVVHQTSNAEPPTLAVPNPSAKLEDKVKAGQLEIDSLEKAASEAKEASGAADAGALAAASSAEKAKARKDKFANLLAEGVVSANETKKAASDSDRADATSEAAKLRSAAAQAALGDAMRALKSAKDKQSVVEGELAAQIANPTPPSEPKEKAVAIPEEKYRLVKLRGPISPVPPPAPVQVDFTSPTDQNQRIAKAQAALDLAQSRYARACIVAPIDGTVIHVSIRPGERTRGGMTAFVIRKQS